jgi:hypothetical protein
VDGSFDAPAERLTSQATEQKLSAFSQRVQGLKAPSAGLAAVNEASSSSTDAVFSLNGQAKIRDGVLSTQRITLQIPGAEADLDGSFNLHDRTVHLLGSVQMELD